MAIRAVVLDLDDTLIEEEATARSSLRSAVALAAGIDPAHGEQVVLACARQLWRTGPHHQVCLELGIASWEGLWATFEGCHARLEGLRNWAPGYRRAAWQAALAQLGIAGARMAEAVADAYVSRQRRGHPLIPGADEVVPYLAGRYRLGLLTNGPSDIQRLKLEQTGLADHFAAVVVSGEVGSGKPNREVFLQVASELGVSPDEAVMVGDSWDRDVVGAQGAGIAAVWVARGRPRPTAPSTAGSVDSISGLPAWLASSGQGGGGAP